MGMLTTILWILVILGGLWYIDTNDIFDIPGVDFSEFQIPGFSNVVNVNIEGQEQADLPDYTPEATTYNLAVELEERMDVMNFWSNCTARGGTISHTANNVGCYNAAFTPATCDSLEAQIVRNECVNVFGAQWICDAAQGDIGCFYG